VLSLQYTDDGEVERCSPYSIRMMERWRGALVTVYGWWRGGEVLSLQYTDGGEVETCSLLSLQHTAS
jgi:hypothetical protein